MGKLKKLFQNWPNGTVATQLWLDEQNIYRQLSNKYVRSGWLQKIGHGAFVKVGDKVDLLGGVFALQHELKMPVHIGGKTALELLGRAHFLPMDKQYSYIYVHGANAERQLPSWFVNTFATNLIKYIRQQLFTGTLGLQRFSRTTFELEISGTERAIFELLALIPKMLTYEHAYLLIQGQELLQVELVQALLENCSSQLIKRLFLHLAKKCQLPVLERLQFNTINLGHGKRTICVSSGIYDPEFKITVPPLNIDEENLEL